jgi:hypothetical protein
MSAPKRIQRKRTKGWRMPEGAVNVTRPSEWSNPFRIGRTVDVDGFVLTITRPLAVALFQALVDGEQGLAEQIRHELAGKTLMCWCPLDQPCHADVLLELARRSAS